MRTMTLFVCGTDSRRGIRLFDCEKSGKSLYADKEMENVERGMQKDGEKYNGRESAYPNRRGGPRGSVQPFRIRRRGL